MFYVEDGNFVFVAHNCRQNSELVYRFGFRISQENSLQVISQQVREGAVYAICDA